MKRQTNIVYDTIVISQRTKKILTNDLLKPIIDEAYKYAGITPPYTIINTDSPYVGNYVQVLLHISFGLTSEETPSKVLFLRTLHKDKIVKMINPYLPKIWTPEEIMQRKLQIKAIKITSEYLYNRLSEVEKQRISKEKFMKQSFEFLRGLLISTPIESFLTLAKYSIFGNFQDVYTHDNPISMLHMECHVYWPFDEVFVVSNFPKAISKSQITYRDGWIVSRKK